jgi:hypothetical protein
MDEAAELWGITDADPTQVKRGAVIGLGERIERKERLWIRYNPFNLFWESVDSNPLWKSVDSESMTTPTNARRRSCAKQTRQDALR